MWSRRARLARDHARQQPEVVVDDALGNRPPRDVDQPQPRLAEQEQQEEEALLEACTARSALRSGPGVTDGTTTIDSPGWLSRIALQTRDEPLLQPGEARAALVARSAR